MTQCTQAIATRPGEAQRQAALRKANAVRVRRRTAREQIAALDPAAGAAAAAMLLLNPPEYALTMRVGRLLTAISGFGTVTVKEITAKQHQRAMCDLDLSVRAAIAAACQQRAAHLKGFRGGGQTVARSKALSSLAMAQRVRLARSAALAHITLAPSTTAAVWRAATLINDRDRPTDLDGLTVMAVLTSIPRIGPHTAGKLLSKLTLSDGTRLGMLSSVRSSQVAATVLIHCDRTHGTRIALGPGAAAGHPTIA